MTVKTIIDVEALVSWTYQVQCADVVIGSGVGLYQGEAWVDGVGGHGGHVGYGFDSCANVRRAAILGCKVDGGGFNAGDLHPDAEAVHDAVMALIADDRNPGLLVLQLGIAGCRPDWREGAEPRWEPCETRQRPDGTRVPVYTYNRDAGIGNRPWLCPMRFIDDPVSIDWARRVYDAWWRGLVALAGAFTANRERLSAHTVTGPAVAAAPWKAQETTGFEKWVDSPGGNH